MPTGYSCIIEEGASFEQFVWYAARGMGALIMMRDDPMDAPIPERFEPSPYDAERLEKARARLRELEGMSSEAADVAAGLAYDSAMALHEERMSELKEKNARYRAVLDKVEAWKPPTAQHEGFKSFLIEQIRISIDSGRWLKLPVAQSGKEWLEAELIEARRQVGYHAKSHEEELERTESRNRWLAELRASVPYAPWVKP